MEPAPEIKTRNSKSRPHRCPKCLKEGSYYGRLIFGDDDPGNCPHHKTTPLVPSAPLPQEGKLS